MSRWGYPPTEVELLEWFLLKTKLYIDVPQFSIICLPGQGVLYIHVPYGFNSCGQVNPSRKSVTLSWAKHGGLKSALRTQIRWFLKTVMSKPTFFCFHGLGLIHSSGLASKSPGFSMHQVCSHILRWSKACVMAGWDPLGRVGSPQGIRSP